MDKVTMLNMLRRENRFLRSLVELSMREGRIMLEMCEGCDDEVSIEEVNLDQLIAKIVYDAEEKIV